MSAVPPVRQMIAELVAVPTVSSLDAARDMGNRGAAEKLAGWLENLGFNCELLPLPGNLNKANLIATRGLGPGGLVLAGHLDTVPYDDTGWNSDPFQLTERDGRMYGLGTADMKSFLAIAVAAAAEFDAGKQRRPLIVLGTADEEITMAGARALAEAGRPRARYAVIGEPTGMKPARIHKGNLGETIRVHGKTGHSSNPALGLNAIEGMQHVMQALLEFRNELAAGTRDAAFGVPHSTLNLGCIHGGDAANRIPACCELRVDLRFLPGLELEKLRAQLRDRASAALYGLPFHIEFTHTYPGCPAFTTPETSAIVQACEELTGHVAGAVDFATEGAVFNQMGMEAVVLGPGGIEQAHQPDEFLLMDRIEPTKALLLRLIGKFCS